MPLEHHEPFNKVRARCCGEECAVGSHRLTDEGAALTGYKLLDHGDDVSDEGITRQVLRTPRASTVTPLVHEEHSEGPLERAGRRQQFTRTAGEAMEQQYGRPGAAQVSDRE